jgi:hypothetical protein
VDITELQDALMLLAGRKWLLLFILIIGWFARLFSDKSSFPVMNIPARWQPVCVVVLAQIYSTATAIQGGVAWRTAVVQGFLVAFVTMGLFDLVVKAVFKGNEPRWIAWLVLIFPKAKSNEAPPLPTDTGKGG